MSLFDMVPKVVEIQHTCHCDTAREQAKNGEPEVHVFNVDGKEFPWHTTKRGPKISRTHDDFYVIDVEILLLDNKTLNFQSFAYDHEFGQSVPRTPIIDGKPFPWLLHEDGFVLFVSHKIIPTLCLKFFAFQVITNLNVKDERPEQWTESDDVYCSGGHLIATDGKSIAS